MGLVEHARTQAPRFYRQSVRLAVWLWRAWPLLIFLVILVSHFWLLKFTSLDATVVNKSVALALQLVGGAFVLYSIDSNIGILKGSSLFSQFTEYLRQFPLVGQPRIVEAKGVSIGVSTNRPKISKIRHPKDTAEWLEYLQEQINEFRAEYDADLKDQNEKLENLRKRAEGKVLAVEASVRQIESKIERVTIGGLKAQVFGVILIIYGAISGYVA